MGHPVIYYSASHPGGRLFDSDDSVGSEWVDHPDKVSQKPTKSRGIDLSASDRVLAECDKEALEQAAREQLGMELDRRKSIRNMIADIRKAQE